MQYGKSILLYDRKIRTLNYFTGFYRLPYNNIIYSVPIGPACGGGDSIIIYILIKFAG